MPLHVTARYKIKPEAVEQCLNAILEFVAFVADNEPETRLYVSLQDSEDETSFLHYFIFEDDAAQERHSHSQAVKRFTDLLYPQTVAPVEFTRYNVVASTADRAM